ncbi:hypothetical protein SNEBB_010597 [Seison nebaliae]|nr:hypothetical protein SNEBB_010597 [Seison nebaliae]
MEKFVVVSGTTPHPNRTKPPLWSEEKNFKRGIAKFSGGIMRMLEMNIRLCLLLVTQNGAIKGVNPCGASGRSEKKRFSKCKMPSSE